MTSINQAAEVLLGFLRRGNLTEAISALEYALHDQTVENVPGIASNAGVTKQLLVSTLAVRAQLGRMSDLIHAAAIVLALPHLLEPGERLTGRPSLAAGNDPTRPFDLETDRRIAEFKLSIWDSGSNAARKRQTFKDLVNLTLDASGRKPQLFVVGPRPTQFLRNSRSTARWALDRFPSTKERFISEYRTLDLSIGEYTTQHATRVEVVDLAIAVPQLFAVLVADQPVETNDQPSS